jgi:hypothetical protein
MKICRLYDLPVRVVVACALQVESERHLLPPADTPESGNFAVQ